MRGARLGIDDPTVLTQVIRLVDGLRLDQADADTKGDLFEHVLRQMKQAGELGQFRTPRHIIRTIVEMVDPQVGETVYDPAAGTAGFLVVAYNQIRLANSSPGGIAEAELDGKTHLRGLGDKLSADQLSTLQTATFFGNDVDPKMVRLSTMNLTLRGLAHVHILQRNVLTTSLDAGYKAALGLPAEGFHVVLANPPFSGRVDKDRIVDEVKIGSTSATELLFLKYMLDSLRPDGRAAVVVPEGVLFGSTLAHRELRRQLIEQHRVEAVLSLPSGVFQPTRASRPRCCSSAAAGAPGACSSCMPTTTATGSTPTTTRPSKPTTCPRYRRPTRVAMQPGRAGRRAMRTPSGPRNGGSPMRPRCAPTTSTCRPAATGR